MAQYLFSEKVVIYYRTCGHGPIPVVFLHGFAAYHATWDDVAALFPSAAFTLFFLDMKGFGFSSKPHDGSYDPHEHAAIISGFIDEQQLSDFILVGHSYGGAVALMTLLKVSKVSPSRIRGLVLISSSAYPQRLPRSLRWLRWPVIGRVVTSLPVRLVVKYTLSFVFYDQSLVDEKHISRYAKAYLPHMSYVLRQSAKQLIPADHASITASYRHIRVPTLIIWGRRDRIVSCRNAVRLRRDIPVSQLVLIDRCGHNPHEERPLETASFIREFIGTL